MTRQNKIKMMSLSKKSLVIKLFENYSIVLFTVILRTGKTGKIK